MKLQSSHKFQGPVQLSHRSQKISPSKWPAAGILGPDLVKIQYSEVVNPGIEGFYDILNSEETSYQWLTPTRSEGGV